MSDTEREPLDLREMMTTAEVAKYLDVAQSTLLAWRNAQINLAYYRVGRRILYRRVDVEAFLSGSRVDPRLLMGVRVETAGA